METIRRNRKRSPSHPYKVLPYECDNEGEKKFDFILDPIPKPPFRLLSVGSTLTGKTTSLINLVGEFLTYEDGTSIFDENLHEHEPYDENGEFTNEFRQAIYIFTPNALKDKKLVIFNETFGSDIVYLSNELDLQIIEGLINRPDDGRNILVFIDDFASATRDMKDKIFMDLYFRARHSGISTIFASQYFYNIPINVRAQASHYMIFPLKDNQEAILLKKTLQTPKVNGRLFDEMMKDCFSEQYNFLFFDAEHQRFYCNWDMEYTTDEKKKPEEKPDEKPDEKPEEKPEEKPDEKPAEEKE
jgi:Poxvirus A32 protein